MTSKQHDERRHFHRILFDAPVSVATEEQQVESKLVDVSLNGALLENPASIAWAQGDQVKIAIKLGDEVSIEMDAEVAHVSDQQTGLRCHHIDMESISHLRRLVELNLGDQALLERDLEALG